MVYHKKCALWESSDERYYTDAVFIPIKQKGESN